MPPNAERRPPQAPPEPQKRTEHSSRHNVRWTRCPQHGWLYVSVVGDTWCVGDGHDVRGHWVETEVAA